MKAEARSLTFLAQEGAVKIPFFQRTYVWNDTNWGELITDLLENDKSHFLGSLILKQVDVRSGETKQVLVIDGQQRLTTLSILLHALFDSFDTELQTKCKQDGKFDVCLFYKKDMFENDVQVKIEHSRIDRKYYQQVIKSEINPNDINIATCKSNILKCYKFFSDRLLTVSIDARKKLFSDLLNPNNHILVVIDLTETDDEQTIFDSINSAGVRLSSADIVKNILFQKAFDLYNNQEEVESLYSEYWENVFSINEDAIAFWDTARTTGRLLRDNVEILLHSISVIEGFFDPEKHTLSDLSKIYKAHIAELNQAGLTSFIKAIAEYAKLYREKILVFDSSELFGYAEYEKRLFHILSVCDVSTFHPYILYLYRKYASNTLELRNELKKVETLVLRRTVCNSESKSYNKLCKEMILDPTRIDELLTETSDGVFKNSLLNISNKHAALLLFWIELYRRKNDNRYDRDELKFSFTLEHIMPQKWEEFWYDVPIFDMDGNHITDAETAKQYRSKLVYSIGNMTLLKSKLNTSVRNYEFARKIDGEGRKHGIRHYAELGITKIDILGKYDSGDKVWNEAKICERTKQLTDDVLKIWD
ncbi:hypothetical protein FACS1894105_00890 [Clostridia bacterium]|nr:hypothetical protein FACS1894105_00890 [Clostridia bacterium]